MSDETEIGSVGASDGRGHPGGSGGEQSPLQARAAFIKNRSWESVISYNRGACARGGAQHGANSESFEATRREWEERRINESTLLEALDFLKSCHRKAPFLFFNGNTFADVARNTADIIFAEVPTGRRRELISSIAHYVAGVLDRDAMISAVGSLWKSAQLSPGDRVKTLRGSLHGVIVRVLDDGRVAWRPNGGGAELIALPESLALEEGNGSNVLL